MAQGSPEVTAKGVIRRLVDRGFLLSVLALIVVLTGWSFLPENLRSLAAISIPAGMIAWLVYLSVAFFSLEILMTRSPGEQIWSRLAAWIALATLGVLAVIVLVGSLLFVAVTAEARGTQGMVLGAAGAALAIGSLASVIAYRLGERGREGRAPQRQNG